MNKKVSYTYQYLSRTETIHKQIATADFTDEQIQELITALQIKRSAKSKLTKEEKVFYQCCRERRSYANNQDLETVVCPICGAVKVIKNGTRNGRQRYFCKNCRKTFGDTNGTVAFRSKMSIGKWIEFIKLTLQGESCRTIAKNLRINKQTVLHNRYRICAVLHQLVSNQDDFRSLAESDEYYYPLSFKDIKEPMFFLGTLGRMPYKVLFVYLYNTFKNGLRNERNSIEKLMPGKKNRCFCDAYGFTFFFGVQDIHHVFERISIDSHIDNSNPCSPIKIRLFQKGIGDTSKSFATVFALKSLVFTVPSSASDGNRTTMRTSRVNSILNEFSFHFGCGEFSNILLMLGNVLFVVEFKQLSNFILRPRKDLFCNFLFLLIHNLTSQFYFI